MRVRRMSGVVRERAWVSVSVWGWWAKFLCGVVVGSFPQNSVVVCLSTLW